MESDVLPGHLGSVRPEPSVEGLSVSELEEELCGLAARLAAATCRFLLAIAEYDRRRGWEAWECHNMAG